MARFNYTHPMTGVRVPRSEVLNARPWAVVKLIGFIVACLAVAGTLLLVGALLTGARINFRTPAVTLAPAVPASAAMALAPASPVSTPPAPAPAPPPVVAQITPPAPAVEPAPIAPAPATSEDEVLERAYKEKLLEERDP